MLFDVALYVVRMEFVAADVQQAAVKGLSGFVINAAQSFQKFRAGGTVAADGFIESCANGDVGVYGFFS